MEVTALQYQKEETSGRRVARGLWEGGVGDNIMEEEHFRYVTQLFYNGEYEQGRVLLTQLLQLHPTSSMLYCNRALFLSQLGQDLEAMEDLSLALRLNPLNYIAYFNLASLQARNSLALPAYRSLACALSALLLLRARLNRSLVDVDASLELASNNRDAHLLRGLLLLQQKRKEQTHSALLRALKIDPTCRPIQKILASLSRTPEHPQLEQEQEQSNPEEEYRHAGWSARLECSCDPDEEADLATEIQAKLAQFNQLYEQINNQLGDVTQKVPRDASLALSPETYMLEHSRTHRSSRSSVIAILQDEGLLSPTPSIAPEPGSPPSSTPSSTPSQRRIFYNSRLRNETPK